MLKGKYFWGALVIIAMWVAVLVIGVAARASSWSMLRAAT